MDWNVIRDKYDIRDVIYNVMPERLMQGRPGSSVQKYSCPFHGGHGPSFVVMGRSQICTCMSHGCNIGGSPTPYANVLHFVKQWYNLRSWKEAAEMLGERMEALSPERKAEYQREIQQSATVLQMSYVNRAYYNFGMAADYFTQRGLSMAVMRKYKLGARPNYTTTNTPFAMVNDDGEKVFMNRLPALRYSIPHFVSNKVFYVTWRLDMNDARKQLDHVDPTLMASVRRYLALHEDVEPEEVPFSTLAYALFGDKYITVGSWTDTIFGAKDIVTVENGVIHGKRMRTVLLTEGQINKLIAESAGVPALATKYSKHLPQVLQNVDDVVVVVDNDPLDWNPVRQTWDCPGLEIAKKTAEATGRTVGSGLRFAWMPQGYNDIGDLKQAGILEDWLQTNDIKSESVTA
jgi:hypothetical protein